MFGFVCLDQIKFIRGQGCLIVTDNILILRKSGNAHESEAHVHVYTFQVYTQSRERAANWGALQANLLADPCSFTAK